MDSCPDLVLEKATGDQRLLPQIQRRLPVFGKKLRESDRRVEIDQRSARSRSSSPRSSSSGATGSLGGMEPGGRTGGVTHPWRTASASRASERSGLRVSRGGTSSATTRSRSVMSTDSPFPTRRTYSESLFFKTFSPTDLMRLK